MHLLSAGLLATIVPCCALAAQVPGNAAARPARAATAAALPPAPTVPVALAFPGAEPGDTTRRIRLDIPAQPLAAALAAFERLTGLRVEAPADIPGTVRSTAVDGLLTAPDALRRLLANTGYRARIAGAERVVVTRWAPGDGVAQDLATVTVSAAAVRGRGYAPRASASATRLAVPLRDVPQAVTVVPQELIADQAMQNMTDVVRYIPGVTMGQGEGHRDAPTIRGQSSTADFFVDGVRDDAQYLRDVYNVERVEALKGGNAMAFGRGGGGGVLNRVTKEAQWAPVNTVTLSGGSWDHRRATVDLGDAVGGRAAARVTGMFEDSRQFRDATGLRRLGVNPTAALLAGGTMLRAGYEYFEDERVVDRGVPSFRGRPSAAPVTTFFGDPTASRSRVAVHAASATVERGSTDGLFLRNRARFTTYDKFYSNVFPSGIADTAGTQVNLAAYDNATDRTNWFNQTDVSYRVATGAVAQTLLVGAELGRQVTDNLRNTGYFGDETRYTVAFDAPTVRGTPVEFRQSATDADARVRAVVAAAWLQDQLELGRHVQAVAGVRVDNFALDYEDRRSGARRERTDRMVSPRAGLVLKPAEPVSVYGTYSVSYLPGSGDQFASLTETTQALKPESFINREVGLKWDVRPDLALTAAVYRLDRTNTRAIDPVNPALSVQTGAQRTSGWEAGLAGNVTRDWQLAAAFAAQSAVITRTTAAAREGATVPLVPARTFSLWNRYQVARRVGLGLGVVHQDDVYAAVDNAVRLPGFTRLDGALFVRVLPTVRLQANLENLLDARYYPTSHGNNNILPGAPRTLRVTLTATR